MSHNYRDLSSLSKAVRILLYLGAAISVLSLLSSLAQLNLLSRDFTESEATLNDLREGLVGLLSLTVYLVTVIVFGVWIYRANKNARGLGATWMQYSPGAAVGWYFVPIVNLWKPYQAMKELWQASHSQLSDAEVPDLLPRWWALWLLAGFTGQLAFRMAFAADDVPGLEKATYAQIGSEVVSIGLCLIAASLITNIHSGQTERANNSTPIASEKPGEGSGSTTFTQDGI